MKNTWIVVANKSEAKIFNAIKNRNSLEEVDVIQNEVARLKEGELTSDGPGHTFDSSTGPGARSFAGEKVAVKHAVKLYTHKISDVLYQAQSNQEYSQLMIVAEPGYLGVLGKELEKKKISCTKSVPKELSHLANDKLYNSLQDEIRETFPLG